MPAWFLWYKPIQFFRSLQSSGHLQINLPSSLISTLDYAFNDDHRRAIERTFPENLGSGSTPLTPKVFISLLIDGISLQVIMAIFCMVK